MLKGYKCKNNQHRNTLTINQKKLKTMRNTIILFLSFCVYFTNAQEKWAIDKCIEHAKANNISIKREKLTSKVNEINFQQSKNNYLPSAEANLSQGLNFGRSLDKSSNTYTTKSSTSTSFSLGTSVNVFNGFRDKNAVDKSKIELLACEQSIKKMENDISLRIINNYLKILLANELEVLSQKQIELTNTQLEKTRSQVSAGTAPEGNLLQIQAQLSTEEYNNVDAKNNFLFAKQDLQQVLDLVTLDNFDVVYPQLTNNPDSLTIPLFSMVYDYAIKNLPEVQKAELDRQSSEKALAIAKGGHLPTVSLSTNIQTGISSARKDMDGSSYGDQIGEHAEYVGVTVSVPIFSQFAVKSNVNQKKIQIENAQLAIQETKLNIYKEIQSAYLDALASKGKFSAMRKTLTSTQEAFRYVDEKYNVGLATSFEYNESKTKLATAESDMVRSKYEFIFKLKILNFYAGQKISL